MKQSLRSSLPATVVEDPLFVTLLGDYLAVLVWSAQVLRNNPAVMPAFAEYVTANCGQPVRVPLAEYQGAALEWLLLGLVELPPPGVIVDSQPPVPM